MKWIDGYVVAHLSRDVRYFLGIVNSTTFYIFEIFAGKGFVYLVAANVCWGSAHCKSRGNVLLPGH